MQNLKLDFLTRLKLATLLGAQEGRVADIRLLSRVIEKIEVTEEERTTSKFKAVPAPNDPSSMAVTWQLPAENPLFGTKEIELEDAEMGKVRDVLSNWPRFSPADVKWVSTILDAKKE